MTPEIKNPASETREQTHEGVTWIDVQNPDENTFQTLEKDYSLHPVHLNESVQKIQFSQVEREDKYIFLLLHVPVYDARYDRIQVHQIGVFLGDEYLITIHNEQNPVIDEFLKTCQHSTEHKDAYFKKGSGHLLYSLIKKLLENLSDLGQGVLDELDQIEYLVFDNNQSDAYQIGKVRQKIIRLKRVIGSMKAILEDLSQQIKSSKWESLTKYYSNNVKTANKLWEAIEEAKETIEVFKDADFTTSTERTNRTLAILTLIFTFTIPITVVGTIYGMNVPLPGGIETGPWTFLGRYTTGLVLFVLSSIAAVGMFVYFKRKKWF